jgi:hypothetical protein
MLITPVITLLCTAGIAFYLRFLLALCNECRPRWSALSKHLRPFSGGYSAPLLRTTDKSVTRQPVIKLTKVNFDVLGRESRKETL